MQSLINYKENIIYLYSQRKKNLHKAALTDNCYVISILLIHWVFPARSQNCLSSKSISYLMLPYDGIILHQKQSRLERIFLGPQELFPFNLLGSCVVKGFLCNYTSNRCLRNVTAHLDLNLRRKTKNVKFEAIMEEKV